jgi:hypothetical protein
MGVHRSHFWKKCSGFPYVQGKLMVDGMFETLEAVPNISSIHGRGVKPYDTLEFEVNGERLFTHERGRVTMPAKTSDSQPFIMRHAAQTLAGH